MNAKPSIIDDDDREAKYEKILKNRGPERIMIKMAATIDKVGERQEANDQADKEHRDASLADAHKWDKATVIKIAGIVALISMATASGASAALGG